MITFWQHIQCTVEICTQYPYLLETYLLLLTLRTTETKHSIEPYKFIWTIRQYQYLSQTILNNSIIYYKLGIISKVTFLTNCKPV